MQGLRSKNPIVIPLDTKIERTIRRKPRDNVEDEEEEFQIEKTMKKKKKNSTNRNL
jgi:hypothetical protein